MNSLKVNNAIAFILKLEFFHTAMNIGFFSLLRFAELLCYIIAHARLELEFTLYFPSHSLQRNHPLSCRSSHVDGFHT